MWYLNKTNENYYTIQSTEHNVHYFVRGVADPDEVNNTADILLKILETGKRTKALKKSFRADNELVFLTNKCQIGCASSVVKASSAIPEGIQDTNEFVFNPERKEAIDYIITKIS